MACNRYDQEDSKEEYYIVIQTHWVDFEVEGPMTLEEAENAKKQYDAIKKGSENPIITKKPLRHRRG